MAITKVLLTSSLIAFTAVGCGKKSKSTTESGTPTQGQPGGPGAGDQNLVSVTGTLALSTLWLAGGNVSQVVAVDPESGKTAYATVGTDGSFDLKIDKSKPWVIGYVDDTKTGSDMLVSSFASGSLDTLSPGTDTTKVSMGKVDVTKGQATMDLSAADLLTSIGMSKEAADTMGSVDDVSRRYSNPDIDSNGQVDAVEGKAYMIDFHNRFVAKKADGSGDYLITDMKNAFLPDDVVFNYSGTGIFPQIPAADLGGTAPASYEWSFSVAMPTASNGGQLCSGMAAGQDIPAGTACSLNYTDNTGADNNALTFNMETANLKAGDYTLKVGDKSYVWKNVAVSDFSAGEGFLALFIRFDVDDAGKLTGLSYKWQKKGADGKYTLATEEDIKLIVKPQSDGSNFGGFVSMKYQNDESKGSLGVPIPEQPQGSIVFANVVDDNQSLVISGSVLTKDMVKAGLSFSDFPANAGISYDDKLGMRFFF